MKIQRAGENDIEGLDRLLRQVLEVCFHLVNFAPEFDYLLPSTPLG